jgi:hypothetical protein
MLQARVAGTRSATSAAVSGESCHSTSMISCSAPEIRSANIPSPCRLYGLQL